MANKLIDINGLKAAIAKLKAMMPRLVTTTSDGLLKALLGRTDYFLRSDGVWASPPTATQSVAGYLSSTDKKKIDGIVTSTIVLRTTINDAWAKQYFPYIFQAGHDGIECLGAKILDIDTTNRVATIRFTVGMENTDAQSFVVTLNGHAVTAGAGNDTAGVGAVVVTVPYSTSGGISTMWNKYKIEYI